MNASNQSAVDEQMNAMQSWVERANEPLHPALVPYMEEEGVLGRMLRHPLVFNVPFFSAGMANDQYAYKKKALAEAIEQGDWHRVVFLHERPYRLNAFLEHVLHCDPGTGVAPPLSSLPEDSELREIAVSVWLDSENIWQNEEDWDDLFAGWAPGDAPVLIDEEGSVAYAALDEEITVWRGCARDTGISWTVDQEIAEFFERRSSQPACVIEARVAKRNIMGVVWGRGESEVLIRRDLVEVVD